MSLSSHGQSRNFAVTRNAEIQRPFRLPQSLIGKITPIMSYRLLRDQWFLIGIFFVTLIGLWDPFGITSRSGVELQKVQATQWGIFFIFVLSGIELRWTHLIDSLKDWKATGLA